MGDKYGSRKIGLFIADSRKRKGMTQKELGDLLNVSNKSVSKWERGICLPDESLFMPLCKILDTQLDELFVGRNLDLKVRDEQLEETILPIINKNQRIKKIKKC